MKKNHALNYYNAFLNIEEYTPAKWKVFLITLKSHGNSYPDLLGVKMNKFGEAEDRLMKILNNCLIDAAYHKKISFVERIMKAMELRALELRQKAPKLVGVETYRTITYIPQKANQDHI